MCVYNPFSLNLLYSGHCFSKFLPPSQGSQILVFISAFPPELQNHIITWSWKSLLSCSSDTLSSCSSVYPKQSLIFFFHFPLFQPDPSPMCSHHHLKKLGPWTLVYIYYLPSHPISYIIHKGLLELAFQYLEQIISFNIHHNLL